MNFVWCRFLCCVFDNVKKAFSITLVKINEGTIILLGPWIVPDTGLCHKDVQL